MVITHSPHEPTVGVVSKGAQRPGRRTVLQSVQSLASVQVVPFKTDGHLLASLSQAKQWKQMKCKQLAPEIIVKPQRNHNETADISIVTIPI